MHPAFDWIAPLHGIVWALDVVAATAVAAAAVVVIMTHIVLTEAALAADAAGAAPGGGLAPVTHHDTTADPAEGINLTTEAGLYPQEDVIAADPALQTINIPGMLQSLWTGSDIEQFKASIPSHKPITD